VFWINDDDDDDDDAEEEEAESGFDNNTNAFNTISVSVFTSRDDSLALPDHFRAPI